LALLNREVIPLTEIRFEKSSGSFISKYAKTINSTTKYACEFLKALSQLTGRNDLEESTFLTWRDVIDPKGAGMLHDHPRWCSRCLQYWRENNQTPYFPLQWYAAPVKYCLEHKSKLVDTCTICGKHQPFIPKHYHIDHCSYCGSWLGHEATVMEQDATFSPSRFDQFAAKAVGEMILQGIKATPYASYARLQNRLKAYAAVLADGVYTELERLVGFRKTVLNQWITKDTRPKIQQLLLLCFRLETTPARLLRDEEEIVLTKISRPFPVHSARPRIKLTVNLRKQLHGSLQAIIDSEDESITFRDACKLLGYTHNFLKYWFPEECRKISDKHKLFLSEKREIKKRAEEETAYNIMMKLLAQRLHINSKIIEKLLRPHKLSQAQPAVRAGIKRAKEEYFGSSTAS
jgi:hypothetical protein